MAIDPIGIFKMTLYAPRTTGFSFSSIFGAYYAYRFYKSIVAIQNLRLAIKIDDFSNLKEHQYVMLEGIIKAEAPLTDTGIDKPICIMRTTYTKSCRLKVAIPEPCYVSRNVFNVHSNRWEIRTESAGVSNITENRLVFVMNDRKKTDATEFCVVDKFENTVKLTELYEIEVDGETDGSGQCFSEVEDDREFTYRPMKNYIVNETHVKIVGQVSIGPDGKCVICPPTDGRPYLITNKNTPFYTSDRNFYGFLSFAFLGAASAIAWFSKGRWFPK